MRKALLFAALLATGVLVVGTVAVANDDDGSGHTGARLNGYQEVSSVSTTGIASFQMKLNRADESVDYVLSYRGLESPVTQAHIHFAQRSVNGPITVWLCDDPNTTPPTPPGPPAQTPPACAGTEGTVEGTFRRNDVLANGRGIDAGEWEELIAAIRVGHAYANIHTTAFPGGEIRGQINDRDQREYTGPPPFASD